MTKRISLALALAAFAMVGAANATPLSTNVADVAMKRHCVPLTIECANPFCAKSAGRKCCLKWACGRAPKKSPKTY